MVEADGRLQVKSLASQCSLSSNYFQQHLHIKTAQLKTQARGTQVSSCACPEVEAPGQEGVALPSSPVPPSSSSCSPPSAAAWPLYSTKRVSLQSCGG